MYAGATVIGDLSVTIEGDITSLDKSVADSEKSLKKLVDAAEPVEKQIASMRRSFTAAGDDLNNLGNVTVNTSTRISQAMANAGRDAVKSFEHPFRFALLDFLATLSRTDNAFQQSYKFMDNFLRRATGFDDVSVQLRRFGLEGGQVTSILKKVGDDFVQIQKPMTQTQSVVTQTTLSLQMLAREGGPAATALRDVADTGMMLRLGGVAAAFTAAAIAVKHWGDELVETGRAAKMAGVDVEEFQRLQKATFITGGLDAKVFATGIQEVAKNLNDARREENDLTRLLDENNIKYKDRRGEVLKTNEGLLVASDLIRRAQTEMDKITIAKAFGLTKDWIPALEQGRQKIEELVHAMQNAGSVTDREMIAKAERFSEMWRYHLTTTTQYVKSFVVDSVDALKEFERERGIIDGVTDAFRILGRMSSAVWANRNREKGSSEWQKEIDDLREYVTAVRDAGETRRAVMRDFGANPFDAGPVKPPPVVGPDEKRTELPTKDDGTKVTLERQLDALRQAVASEDEALQVRMERQAKQIETFEAKKLLTESEALELRVDVLDKFERDRSELVFSRLEQGVMTEAEILQRKHEQQLEMLDQFEKSKTITVEQAENLRRKIQAKSALDVMRAQAAQYSQLAGIVDTSMSQISQIMSKEGGAQFEIMKAISMATALVKGYEAVLGAYAAGNNLGGPAVGYAFAAIAAAGVAAQIANIAQTKPGSAAGGVSAPSSGGAATAAASAAPSAAQSSQTMYVRGIGANDLFTGDMVKILAGKLLQHQKDGGVVVLR